MDAVLNEKLGYGISKQNSLVLEKQTNKSRGKRVTELIVFSPPAPPFWKLRQFWKLKHYVTAESSESVFPAFTTSVFVSLWTFIHRVSKD